MAATANLYLDQGADFSVSMTLLNDDNSPYDLTNHTVESQIRKSYDSTASVDFGVFVDTSTAEIVLILSGAESQTLTQGRYVYDVKIFNGQASSRILEGILVVNPAVTR